MEAHIPIYDADTVFYANFRPKWTKKIRLRGRRIYFIGYAESNPPYGVVAFRVTRRAAELSEHSFTFAEPRSVQGMQLHTLNTKKKILNLSSSLLNPNYIIQNDFKNIIVKINSKLYDFLKI